MSSDEEYLDDLLKSLVEDEGESGSAYSAVDGPTNENLAGTDTEGMADIGFDDLSPDLTDENMAGFTMEGAGMENTGTPEELPEDFAIQDIGMEGEPPGDFAIQDTGMEEEPSDDFDLQGIGMEKEPSEDFAIQDIGMEEEPPEDFALQDIGMEGEPPGDFVVQDTGVGEEPTEDFAIQDIGLEEEPPEDFAIQDIGLEEEPPEDFAIQDIGLEEGASADFGITQEEPMDDFAIEDFGVVEPEEGELDALEESHSDDDVDAMFAAADAAAQGGTHEIEINSEEDMLALLDSMSSEIEAEQAAAEQAALAEKEAKPESGEEEGKKKKKKKLFGSKKKEEADKTGEPEGEDGEGQIETDKKPGFFSKLLTFLTESDEEEEDALKEGLEPSDENKSILEELDKEDKKKKKKKDKGKKGKEEGEEEEAPKKEKKEKKKKEKKEKKDPAAADALEEAPERPSKRVSKKSVAVIAGLGLTLTAMVIVLCSIVPAFFDKREARDAYYQADYKKTFDLLYGKALDDSDTIMYNQSLTILEMNRKLDAYHNYLAIGEEVRALDALMIGIQKYPDVLLKAEEFHVTQEVNAVYETMLSILNDKYGLSENDANVIIAYDDVTYTKKLESVVNGTPFVDPNAQQASADVLPEEEDFYESTANVLGEETEPEAQPDVPEETPSDAAEETPEDASAIENSAQQQPAEDGMEADNVLGTDTEDNYIPEETAPEENTVPEENTAPEENTQAPADNAGSSQGQMIQGVRQPIDVQIHGR